MNRGALLPYIPETITVHLGSPSVDAANVTVPFTDYIKNVASSEIYPTWRKTHCAQTFLPRSALP